MASILRRSFTTICRARACPYCNSMHLVLKILKAREKRRRYCCRVSWCKSGPNEGTYPPFTVGTPWTQAFHPAFIFRGILYPRLCTYSHKTVHLEPVWIVFTFVFSFIKYNFILLGVRIVIAGGMFCGTRNTYDTLTPIIKQQIK